MSSRVNVEAILAVAQNTFKESARNRVLYALVGATIFVSGLSYVLVAVSGVEDADPSRKLRIVADVSLSAIALLGSLCAIFLGTNLVYQEVERKTVYTILARPIGRGEFVLGKFLGLSSVVVAAVLVMALGFALIFIAYGGAGSLSPRLFLAIAFTAVELVVVVAIALVFSAIAHPIEGAIFAFVVTLAGHATENLNRLGEELLKLKAGQPPPGIFEHGLSKVLWVLYVILPNLENLNFRADAVTPGFEIEPGRPGFALMYALLYTTLLLAIAAAAFRRKTL
ncbi:ABC transporter permease subunit [bacterium]|nr:ABC transporter permease subunit [bacterium]